MSTACLSIGALAHPRLGPPRREAGQHPRAQVRLLSR